MPAEPTAVEYIGKNGEFIPGVPAEDHVVETKTEANRLVESGLYRIASAKKAAAMTAEPTTEKPEKGEGE